MGDGIQNNYALIINGDSDDRHLENVERSIKILKAEGRFDIFVANTKRPNETIDQFKMADSDNLEQLIDGIRQKTDDDDLILIYVTGHGDQDLKNNGFITLSDGPYPLIKLAQQFSTIAYGERIVVMDQCCSGNGLSLFADNKTTVVTGGSKGELVCCDLIAPVFWSDDVPDLNQDGVITVQERYAHMLDNLQVNVEFFPRYYSPLGKEMSLVGQEETSNPFAPKVIDVFNKTDFETELSHLKPGQLALVMFSTDWCGPCKAYQKVFNSLAKDYDGQFLMLHLEGLRRSEREWAKDYHIFEYPTVAFIDHEGRMMVVPPENRDQPADLLTEAAIVDDQTATVSLLIKKLQSHDPKVRTYAAHKIGSLLAYEAIPDLIQCLQDENKDVQIAANQSLLKMREKAVSQLIDQLSHEKKENQIAAIHLLGIWHEQSAIHNLVLCLKDNDAEVRLETMKSLSTFNTKETFLEFITLLEDPDPSVRNTAIRILASKKISESIPALLERLEDNDPEVRASAVFFISQMNITSAIPTFRKLVKDDDAKVRRETVIALGKVNAREASADLMGRLYDQDAKVRSAAVEQLTNMQIYEASLLLIERLNDDDPYVRQLAIKACEKLEIKAACPNLIAIINNKTEVPYVRTQSMWALAKLKSKKSIPELLKIKKDENEVLQVRQMASSVLKEMKVLRTIVVLERLVVKET